MRRWILAAVFAGAAGAALAAGPGLYDVTGIRADDVLNIRSEPSVRGARLGGLAPTARGITVIEVAPNGWLKIRTPTVTGWVSGRYMTPVAAAGKPGTVPGGGTRPVVVSPGTSPVLAPGDRPAVVPDPSGANLVCSGTEPFWGLTGAGAGLALTRMGMTEVRDAAIERVRRPAGGSVTIGRRLTAIIQPAACSDGMSDRRYRHAATVLVGPSPGASVLTGCCTVAP